MKKKSKGFTAQGVRDLSFIKGKSRGIVLEMPPDMLSSGCSHPTNAVVPDKDGDLICKNCKAFLS